MLLIHPDATDVWPVLAELIPGQPLERGSLSEGLSRLARETFDAVLVDLPNSPLNAVEQVLGVDPGAMVIALGDRDDGALAIDTIRTGAEEYLVKSVVTTETLARVLHLAIERRRARLARSQSRKLEAMGRLAFGVAHDLNNLLTVISGNADLALAELPEGEPSRQELEEIGDAAQRAALLTRQLLAFSGKQILKPVAVDPNALVRGVETPVRRLIGEDISLGTKLEPGLGTMKADPAQIEQVLMNLAMNARDAMPQGGQLGFETKSVESSESYPGQEGEIPAGAYVMLAVSDSGIGMDADTRSRVFEPFFTTKERGKGMGLGLSTVYGIVKQSDGHIWVSSEPGMGSTFKIYLPRADSGASPAAHGKSKRAAETRGETVLVVEDDTKVLEVAHRFLEEGGYQVISTSQIAEALAIVEDRRRPIHLLATDVVMPGMSGRELAERLRSVRPGLKTLYISGYTDDAIDHHGVLGPGVEFLEKPYSSQDLLAAVRRALDRAD